MTQSDVDVRVTGDELLKRKKGVSLCPKPRFRQWGSTQPLTAVWIIVSSLVLSLFLTPVQAQKPVDGAVMTQQAAKEGRTGTTAEKDGWVSCTFLQETPNVQKAATSEKKGPRNKDSYHDVTFNNCYGTYNLHITRMKYECMDGPGNEVVNVPVGQAYQINLEDDDSGHCDKANKSVTWNIEPLGQLISVAEWIHSYTDGQDGTWQTMIEDPNTKTAGHINWAFCDYTICLNRWVTANEGRPQVVIVFQ